MQPERIFRPVFVASGERSAGQPVDARESESSVATLVDTPGLLGNGISGTRGPGVSSFAQPGVLYPEVAVFRQFDQILPHMTLVHPFQRVQTPTGHQQYGAIRPEEQRAVSARACRTTDNRGSSDYALRHQAAEQRRRTRINERLDRLRKVVPHAERANTASFLEQVLTYIETLKKQISELESKIPQKAARGKNGRSHREEPSVDELEFEGHDDSGPVVGLEPAVGLGTPRPDECDCQGGKARLRVAVRSREGVVGILDSCPGTPPAAPLREGSNKQQPAEQGEERCLKRGPNSEGGLEVEKRAKLLPES